jgi:hypothetical protein
MNLSHPAATLAPYRKDRLHRAAQFTRPKRIWVAMIDHFEPLGMNVFAEAHAMQAAEASR